ncbi:hypothetical protein KAMAJI_00370 [Serratia phage vB_SmaM-Kamaji]|nr:hypothetical protein KAMAJI_00370 [Serratia phage vB_SmaM-Kamaji]
MFNDFEDEYSKYKYQVAFGLMGCANFTIVARTSDWDIAGAGTFSVPECECEDLIDEIYKFNRGHATSENWEYDFPKLATHLPQILEPEYEHYPWALDTLELKLAILFGSAGGPLGAAPQLIFTENNEPIESYV